MFDLYQNVLKENYGKEVNLVYMGANCFLIEFVIFDVYREMQNSALKERMGHHLYSEENKAKLVYQNVHLVQQ